MRASSAYSRKRPPSALAAFAAGPAAGLSRRRAGSAALPFVQPGREEYAHYEENRFRSALQEPLSTFSLEADGASYAVCRRKLASGRHPEPDAVRIEELLNYFSYDYPAPEGEDPLSLVVDAGPCPWEPSHRLVRIGLRAREIPAAEIPPSNFIYLIDVSGSMTGRLPLVQASMKMLTDNLRPGDRVSVVTYADGVRVVSENVPGSERRRIKDVIDGLTASGSTAGGAGLECAYEVAGRCFIPGGNNRIVLLSSDMTKVVRVITGFENHGVTDTFQTPTGVAVASDDTLYIADSLNRRVVVLNPDDTLNRIIEIPQLSGSVKALGGVTYAVGTHIEGMGNLNQETDVDGMKYRTERFTSGSATELADEQGTTYQVSAYESTLQPLVKTVTDSKGATYAIAENGKSVIRTNADGSTFTYARYDATTNIDLFILIGRLIKGNQNITGMSGLIGLALDEQDNLYCISAKTVVVLDQKGNMVTTYGNYRNADDALTSFATISEFALDGDSVFIRDADNHIVELDRAGSTRRVIESNCIRKTDADGNITRMTGMTGAAAASSEDEETAFQNILGIELTGDYLIVGEKNGEINVMKTTGKLLGTVENNSLLLLDTKTDSVSAVTTVKNGKQDERLTEVSATAMVDWTGTQRLCVKESTGRVLVLDDNWTVLHTAQNNCVEVQDRNGAVTERILGVNAGSGYQAFAEVSGVEGVALNSASQLCIADSDNRLIVLDGDKNVARVTVNPNSEVLDANFLFTPLKVSVDYAGRVYCIAQNMFEGIMVFETNGDFTGFFGTISVEITAWEKFWRKLATKEERSKQQLFIPTEFTGIDIDDEGFVYASNKDTAGTQAVRRLNPKGEDVIRMGQTKNLGGDMQISGTSQYAGASTIVDVVYREKGIYSLLDSKRGRIITYDHEGNLLYIFGGLGTQAGTMEAPVAIECAGEKMLALDSKQGVIAVFGETEYGRLINEAVGLRYDGDETQAVALWQEVLRMDENNELANTGIGKAYLSAGDNEKAMEYLKRGMNRDYYSVAFKRYRNDVLKSNINYILTGIIAVIVAIIVVVKVIRPRRNQKNGRRA